MELLEIVRWVEPKCEEENGEVAVEEVKSEVEESGPPMEESVPSMEESN